MLQFPYTEGGSMKAERLRQLAKDGYDISAENILEVKFYGRKGEGDAHGFITQYIILGDDGICQGFGGVALARVGADGSITGSREKLWEREILKAVLGEEEISMFDPRLKSNADYAKALKGRTVFVIREHGAIVGLGGGGAYNDVEPFMSTTATRNKLFESTDIIEEERERIKGENNTLN